MKKNFIRAFALLTLVGLTSACNNSAPKMDEEPEAVATTTGEGMRIAYIEIDTLTAQYEFAKVPSRPRRLSWRRMHRLSSRSSRAMASHHVSRPRPLRLTCSASSRTSWPCSSVWRTSWPTSSRNSCRLSRTVSITSCPTITRTRSMI